jgi:MtN3 and saliva related transmembrane protein
MNLLAIVTMCLGVFASLSFLFQTLKIMHLHESRDVALSTYTILFVTAIFWLLYGISISDLPLMVSYTVGTLSTFSVIIVYFVYKKQGKLKKPKSR